MRVNVEELNEKENTFSDIKGHSLQKWIDYGTAGWDEIRKTYFIQLDTNEDIIPWWLGKTPGEIKTFNQLCEKINKIFNVKNGFFKFENIIKLK